MTDTKPYRRRQASLERERASWISHWREISRFLLPRAGRFLETDRNLGNKRHQDIYDPSAGRFLNILSAGMMAGITSPARPWFRVLTPDMDLNESDRVKEWLFVLSTRLHEVFSRSNTYRVLQSIYSEQGAFGTGAAVMQEDFQDVLRLYPMTVGEYSLSHDERYSIGTMYRGFSFTVEQMVQAYGLKNVSQTVRTLYNKGNMDAWVPVVHGIERRKERDTTKRDSVNKKYSSVYFEKAAENPEKLLRESGYDDFPVLAPRWAVTGSDVYGTGPGMEALGSIFQLQQMQLRKSQVIDYMTMPPLQGPGGLKQSGFSAVSGGITTYEDARSDGLKPVFQPNLDLSHLTADIADTRQILRESFYADLFLMLADSHRSNTTATEIVAQQEEKLLMLGPVLERQHSELAGPLIETAFVNMIKADILPPPPPEIQGMDLQVEYVSMLAQAQRAAGLGSIDRLLGTVASLQTMKPDIVDKINGDEIIDMYADRLGVSPDVVVANERVAVIRDERVRQQQQQEQMENMAQATSAAKLLSETDTENKNGLTDVMKAFSGGL